MFQIRPAAVALFLIVVTAAVQALDVAPEAQKKFDDLFGSELKRVEKTADRTDDLALAQTFIGAASGADIDPAMAIVLLLRAHELAAASPEGVSVAIEAAQVLAETAPEHAGWAREAVADLRLKAYQRARGDERTEAGDQLIDALIEAAQQHLADGRGDEAVGAYRRTLPVASAIGSDRTAELKRGLDETSARNQIFKQIDVLKTRLKGNVADKTVPARDLVLLYLIELDQPAEARKYTFLTKDETLSQNVRHAGGEFDSLDAATHYTLGLWYDGLTASASSDLGRQQALTHASQHLQAYLDADNTSALQNAKAKASLTRIETALTALESANTTAKNKPGKWIDALAYADPSQARIGTWSKKGKTLMVETGDGGREAFGLLSLPLQITGSYDVQIKLARLEGDTVVIGFPVGSSSTGMAFDMRPIAGMFARGGDEPGGGRGGALRRDPITAFTSTYSGLHQVDGKSASDEDNPTRLRGGLKDKRETSIGISVRVEEDKAQITVTLSGKTIVRWTGLTEKLSGGLGGGGRRDRALGGESAGGELTLGVMRASAIFRSIQVKSVDGEIVTPDAGS